VKHCDTNAFCFAEEHEERSLTPAVYLSTLSNYAANGIGILTAHTFSNNFCFAAIKNKSLASFKTPSVGSSHRDGDYKRA